MVKPLIQTKKIGHGEQYFLILFILLGLQGCDLGKVNSKKTVKENLSTDNKDYVPPAAPEDLIPDEFQAVEDEDDGNDPLAPYTWHLRNTGLQDGFSANRGKIGEDVNGTLSYTQGIKGRGVRIAISDNGVELAHQDLQSNVLTGLSRNYQSSNANFWRGFDPTPGTNQSTAAHGTAVAGLAVARDRNNHGSRGVAPLAKFAGFKFVGAETTLAKLIDQADGDFDIFNYSYGRATCSYTKLPDSYHEQLKFGATNLRSGKGALYVKAAGNEYVSYLSDCVESSGEYYYGNANFESDHSYPYVIVVGANDARGFSSVYSSPGSSLWISAPGGAYGDTHPALISTDLSGCDKGFSHKDKGINEFDLGNHSLNPDCHYTSTMNGTSGASPLVSGVIALLLETNPALTWREVKYILAKSARKIDSEAGNTQHPGGLNLSGHTYQYGWLTNNAGFHFHNWYGFGAVDIDRAVALAKSWNKSFGSFIETAWLQNNNQSRTPIPDNSSVGVNFNLNITQQLKIEAVQIRLTIDHQRAQDLGIELRSPSGMRTKLTNINSKIVDKNFVDLQMLSNAFYMENSAGTWTLSVVDGQNQMTGELVNWKLKFFGHTETAVSPRGQSEGEIFSEDERGPSQSVASAAALLSLAVDANTRTKSKNLDDAQVTSKTASRVDFARKQESRLVQVNAVQKNKADQQENHATHGAVNSGRHFGDLSLPIDRGDQQLKLLLTHETKTWAIGVSEGPNLQGRIFLVEQQGDVLSAPYFWSSPENHSIEIISGFLNSRAQPNLLVELSKKDHPATLGLLEFSPAEVKFHQIEMVGEKLLFAREINSKALQLVFQTKIDEIQNIHWSKEEGIIFKHKIPYDLRRKPKFMPIDDRIFISSLSQLNSQSMIRLDELKAEGHSFIGEFRVSEMIADYHLGFDHQDQSFSLFAEKIAQGLLKDLKAHDLALFKLDEKEFKLLKTWGTPDEEYIEDYQVANGVHSLLATTRSNFRETNLGERDIVFIEYNEKTQSEYIQHWGRDQKTFKTSGDEMNLKFRKKANQLEIWGETTGPFLEPNQGKRRDLIWFPWSIP